MAKIPFVVEAVWTGCVRSTDRPVLQVRSVLLPTPHSLYSHLVSCQGCSGGTPNPLTAILGFLNHASLETRCWKQIERSQTLVVHSPPQSPGTVKGAHFIPPCACRAYVRGDIWIGEAKNHRFSSTTSEWVGWWSSSTAPGFTLPLHLAVRRIVLHHRFSTLDVKPHDRGALFPHRPGYLAPDTYCQQLTCRQPPAKLPECRAGGSQFGGWWRAVEEKAPS